MDFGKPKKLRFFMYCVLFQVLKRLEEGGGVVVVVVVVVVQPL